MRLILLITAVALLCTAIPAPAADAPVSYNFFQPAPVTVTSVPNSAAARAFNFFLPAAEAEAEVPTRTNALHQFADSYAGTRWYAQGEATRDQLVRMYGFRAEDLEGMSEFDCGAILGGLRTGRLPHQLRPRNAVQR